MLKRLFSPLTINNCTIPNRLAVTAMVAGMCAPDGTATDQYIAYHETKAKGGWGLIITEDYAVNYNARNIPGTAGLYSDEQIESHKKLTNAVHKYNSKIFCQMFHAGRQSNHFTNNGVQPMAPSAIPCPVNREIPRELTIPEIEQFVKDFGACAKRAKEAGFDGVEIHAAHGYLIAEFLSPYANKRTDKYGGCLENRVRFLKEIYEEVRKNVGADFPVIVRFSAVEEMPGSRDLAESRALAMMFEEWGFDALDVSASVYGNHINGIISSMYSSHAWHADFVSEIKKLVNIPVFTVNRITEPRVAESLLAAGKADMIGMGRQSLADPDYPNKVKNGEYTNIRKCVGCLQECYGGLLKGRYISCLVNPTCGRELEVDLSTVENPKNVLIIGGGIAGMEAARAASMKGHKVSLYEKQNFLGGQFKSAAYPPCKGDFASYTGWLIKQLKDNDVKIHLNTTVTEDLVKSLAPDSIIIATGGTPLKPNIKGIDNANICTAEDILLGRLQPAEQIVVAGGGEVGIETAAHLGLQERNVTVVEMKNILGEDLIAPLFRNHLTKIMNEFEVKHYTGTKILEFQEDGVLVENEEKGTFKIPAQQIVLALGYKPETSLLESLKSLCSDVKIIGGAVKTSNAAIASYEGFFAGMNI